MKIKRIKNGSFDCKTGTIKTVTSVSETGTIYYKNGVGTHYTSWEIVEDIKSTDRFNPRLMGKEDVKGRYFKLLMHDAKNRISYIKNKWIFLAKNGDLWSSQKLAKHTSTDT